MHRFYLAQETAGLRKFHLAILEATSGIGQEAMLLGTRDGHITEASLLL
jgi:hypothetical protein